MEYPEMFRIRQILDAPTLGDVPQAVREEIQKVRPGKKIRPGDTVALAVGSRGIANLDRIVKTVIEELQALGAQPYIVPAMGSHGGGTAEGQVDLLAGYGITEGTMGISIRASMEVIQIDTTDFGMPVYFDRNASEADHVVVINRVKPHTGFAGEIESGLMKMMLIGLGKHKGALVYHRAIVHHSFDKIVKTVGRVVRYKMPIAFGVAILENGYDETARIAVLETDDLEEGEKALQRQAKAWCPKLPFEEADLLIIDEMGKNISGTGMDTNVIGRKRNDRTAIGDERPRVMRIFVRDLTQATHGNATGIGLAEFTTDRLVEKIDRNATYINSMTGQHVSAASTPMHFPTDREVLDVALQSIGLVEPHEAKILWIRNTLDLGEIEASIRYLDEARQRSGLRVMTDPRPLDVGPDGNLPPQQAFGRLVREAVA